MKECTPDELRDIRIEERAVEGREERDREHTPGNTGGAGKGGKFGYGLQIAYASLLDLFLPIQIALAALFIYGIWECSISADMMSGFIKTGEAIYFLSVFIIGILNIVRSFKTYRKEPALYSVKSMLIIKYGLIVFYIMNLLFIVAMTLLAALGSFVASRGTIIFFFLLFWPSVLAGGIALYSFLFFLTWLTLLPGAFYGIQTIRHSLKAKKTNIFFAVIHALLQFTFMIDILDAMYLAAVKWKTGRKSSAVVLLLYVIFLIALIWGISEIISAVL